MAPPYHEAYWVVIATAAPVIALAAIVAFNPANISLEHIIRSQPREGPAADKLPINFWPRLFNFIALILCVISQLGAFILSLLILATKNDGNNLVAGGVLTAGGLFLLSFATFFYGFTRIAEAYDAWANQAKTPQAKTPQARTLQAGTHQADNSDETPENSRDS